MAERRVDKLLKLGGGVGHWRVERKAESCWPSSGKCFVVVVNKMYKCSKWRRCRRLGRQSQ